MKKVLSLLVLILVFSCQETKTVPIEQEAPNEVLTEGVVYGDSLQTNHYECLADPDSIRI